MLECTLNNGTCDPYIVQEQHLVNNKCIQLNPTQRLPGMDPQVIQIEKDLLSTLLHALHHVDHGLSF
jgi:hypothetical protein